MISIPNIWKNKKCSKPPTSIICIILVTNIITLYKYQVAGTPIDEIDPILNQLSTRAYFKVYYNCRLRHRHVDSKHTKEKTATLR